MGKQKRIEEEKRKRWEKKMKKQVVAGVDEGGSSTSSSVSDDDDELPLACPCCSSLWEKCKSVIVQTVCGHYFCEDCAMESFARTPKCIACGAPTNGIFNSCDALEQKIKQQ